MVNEMNYKILFLLLTLIMCIIGISGCTSGSLKDSKVHLPDRWTLDDEYSSANELYYTYSKGLDVKIYKFKDKNEMENDYNSLIAENGTAASNGNNPTMIDECKY